MPARENISEIAAPLVPAALFAGLAVALKTGRARDIDKALRHTQPHPRRGVPRRVARAVKRIAAPKVQLPVAAVLTILLRRKRVPGAAAPLAAAAIAFLVERACKRLVRRRRPPTYRGKELYESFPSGHTASTAALSLTLATLLERDGIVRAPLATSAAVVLIALVGETRLVLDEHWPSDVLAGALLGTAAAGISRTIIM